MPNCTFCGAEEDKASPLCQSCGALRYPIEKKSLNVVSRRKKKLKLSASLAAAIVTPGSLIVLALIGAKRIKLKIKNRKL
ncbi:MAG: hypothetical protein KAH20_03715 [Methylococcales bacterium]|nr:hypothetical protein [Methylococcales bacterium]